MNTDSLEVEGYYSHDQSDLLKLVHRRGRSALEIGCAGGNLLKQLSRLGYERITGVEYVDDVARQAALAVPEATILSGSIDDISDKSLGTGYDLVIVNFVLEHVMNPTAVLTRAVSLLNNGGQVIGALPNVRHWSVTLPLIIGGRFDYEDEGILDKTHYRFFTRKSIRELLEQSGLADIAIHPWVAGRKSLIGNNLTFGRMIDHFAFAHRFSGTKL